MSGLAAGWHYDRELTLIASRRARICGGRSSLREQARVRTAAYASDRRAGQPPTYSQPMRGAG